MNQLIAIKKEDDIPEAFRGTPIGDLLLYHNIGVTHQDYQQAKLIIGMCMDHRKTLNIPKNFAYIIRSGGANLQHSIFHISYAIGVAGIRHMAIIGHTDCGMVNVEARKEKFVKGLCEQAGWDATAAEEYFVLNVPQYEIGNEISFTSSETHRLSQMYPKIKFAPLLYNVEDNQLYWIDEK